MDLTTALTGGLAAIICVAAPLTAVTSAFLLWLFRRATLRGMALESGAAESAPETGKRGITDGGRLAPLTIKSQHAGAVFVPPSTEETYRRTARSLRAVAWTYGAGGLVYALILAIAWLITAGDGFILSRFLWLAVNYAWPLVLVVVLVATTGGRETLTVAGGYLAVLSVVTLIGLGQSSGLSIGDLIFVWIVINGPGTLLLLAFLYRRVRAVGPLVLVFMVAGVTGAFLAIEVLRASEGLMRGIVAAGLSVGVGAITIFVLMHLVGFALFGLFGWWLLGWLGRRFQAKRLSDQSLTIDALWLLFGIVQPIILVFEGVGWILTGLVAFAAYKLVTSGGFVWVRRHAPGDDKAPMLLLLRVFALGRRSERFFDLFSKWWLRAGSISLIAGPDLVTTVVKPYEFLDFVSGRLSRQFVQGRADLEQRLAKLDRRPDPDGRYRVNEFFCHADTWQMTMRRLARESDAVLMDLRSFSPTNQGCLYELEQLLNIVDLERVVFLVDETTDQPFLAETLQALWQAVDHRSPNRRVVSPTVRLFQAGVPSKRSVRALLLMLFGVRSGP